MRQAPAELHLARHARLRQSLRASNLDALIVTSLPNIAYLTGLFASTAALLVGADELTLLVDARYRETAAARQAELEGLGVLIVGSAGSFDESIAEAARRYRDGKVGVEANHMTLRQHRSLEVRLAADVPPAGLVATDGLVENLRTVKDSWEIQRLRDAAGEFRIPLSV